MSRAKPRNAIPVSYNGPYRAFPNDQSTGGWLVASGTPDAPSRAVLTGFKTEKHAQEAADTLNGLEPDGRTDEGVGADAGASWTRTTLTSMPLKLVNLADRVFENLAYDLLSARGVENLVWRTPGADGGRDLEGVITTTDFAGYSRREAWYFECKRYTSSISWPIVFEKVAYARNANAENLLVLTSSQFSPNCVDEMNRWNIRQEKPTIRQWAYYDIERILADHPFLAMKYGLHDSALLERSPIAPPLVLELVKSANAAYSAQEFLSSPRQYIELSAAIADLIAVRTRNLREHGKVIIEAFEPGLDSYSWLDGSDVLAGFDRCGARAFCNLVRLQARAVKVVAERKLEADGSVWLRALGSRPAFVSAQSPDLTESPVLREVCAWSDIEVIGAISEGLAIKQRAR